MAAALGAFYTCVLCYGLLRLYITPQSSSSVLVGFVETHAGRDKFPHEASSAMAIYEG